jgi:cobyrinic acid a,c-diamide synthase
MNNTQILTKPRIVTAALKGGAGKTLLTAGIIAALRNSNKSVAAFKKGPDYIDAGWLGKAAGAPCYNLDAFLQPAEAVKTSFAIRSASKDFAVVEGNRGLFDGVDSLGSYSTAELAKLLKSPVILIVDATKITRTAAAMVLGCLLLDPDLSIKGVILNRVAGVRHETVLTQSIEDIAGIPVIGAVKKLSTLDFPQRHLGLLPLYEHPQADSIIREASKIIQDSVDMEKLTSIAGLAGNLEFELAPAEFSAKKGIRIGVLNDAAFQFYYPENLEALEKLGADVVFLSGLNSAELPDLDAMYIGGGFPETHAVDLSNNAGFRASLLEAARSGMPIYAECGGLMYLSKNLLIDDKTYPMVGVFPIDTVLGRKPQGHGYIEVEAAGINPFYQTGTILKGHEFHYSYVVGAENADFAFKVLRGHGIDGSHDGICAYNCLGTYVHVHALGEPQWAEALVDSAEKFKTRRMSK